MSVFTEHWMTEHAQLAQLAQFSGDDLHIKLAQESWELVQYFKLRKATFSEEQGLLVIDRDANDPNAIAIVAICNSFGMADQVIGAVRIYQTEPGIWFGGRLCVKPIYRQHHAVGKKLINKAVCSAIERGCQHFYATVQLSNEHYFQQLHWQTRRYLEVAGQRHALMEAELAAYPLSHAQLHGSYQREQQHV